MGFLCILIVGVNFGIEGFDLILLIMFWRICVGMYVLNVISSINSMVKFLHFVWMLMYESFWIMNDFGSVMVMNE